MTKKYESTLELTELSMMSCIYENYVESQGQGQQRNKVVAHMMGNKGTRRDWDSCQFWLSFPKVGFFVRTIIIFVDVKFGYTFRNSVPT